MTSLSFKERGHKNSDVICGLPLNMTYNTVISQVALHHLSISIPDISTQKACLMDGVFRLRLLKNLSNWVWERRGNKEPDEKGTVENQKRCQPKRLFFYSQQLRRKHQFWRPSLFILGHSYFVRALSIGGIVLRCCLVGSFSIL